MSLQKKIILVIAAIIALVTLAAVAGTAFFQRQNIHHAAGALADDLTTEVDNLLSVTDSIMRERVVSSMKLLIERGTAAGEASQGEELHVGTRTVTDLQLGGWSQTSRFELVDGVTEVMGGTATLFSLHDGEFVRISTNVRSADGQRAIGTILDPQGAAIAQIRQGRPFYGQVDILGNPFLTGYEPIHDADNRIIGIWYVGYSADLQTLTEVIGRAHIKERGFVALLDGHGNVRIHSRHVAADRIAGILAGEEDGWKIGRTAYAPWGYTIATAYSNDEVNAEILRSLAVIAAALILVGLLLVVILVLASRGLTRRISLLHRTASEIPPGQQSGAAYPRAGQG